MCFIGNQVFTLRDLQKRETFMHRTSGDTEEMLLVCFGESSIALGDVRRDGCGGSVQLIPEEVISFGEVFGYRENRFCEID